MSRKKANNKIKPSSSFTGLNGLAFTEKPLSPLASLRGTLCALLDSSWNFSSVMSLTNNQIKHLRKLAHNLKVIVIVGNAGLTENVLLEIDNALNTHELVKVRINGEREERTAMIEQIQQHTQSVIIQTIGFVAVFYRQADKPVIELPKK